MKKLFLSILVLLGTTLYGQAFSIEASSFNTTDSIELGSEQWVDVFNHGGPYTVSTRTVLYIYHINESNQQSNSTKIFDVQFYTWWDATPYNPDGTTKRITFNIPAVYPSGKFKLTTLDYTPVYGLIKNPVSTGIMDYQFSSELNPEPVYYNLQGQIVEPVQGFYIKVTGYNIEKVFIQ